MESLLVKWPHGSVPYYSFTDSDALMIPNYLYRNRLTFALTCVIFKRSSKKNVTIITRCLQDSTWSAFFRHWLVTVRML